MNPKLAHRVIFLAIGNWNVYLIIYQELIVVNNWKRQLLEEEERIKKRYILVYFIECWELLWALFRHGWVVSVFDLVASTVTCNRNLFVLCYGKCCHKWYQCCVAAVVWYVAMLVQLALVRQKSHPHQTITLMACFPTDLYFDYKSSIS